MKKIISIALATVALSYAAIVSFFCAMFGTLDHDEHQFMASAYMVAQHCLQPFRDFAYFHLPNLVYVYAPFFYTGNPFLVARVFTALCAFGLCLTIFLIARSLFHLLGTPTNTLIAAAGTILLCNTLLFQYASSKIWNHLSAALCAVLAFFVVCRAVREPRLGSFALSGFALGMAVGIRFAFVPLILPFVLFIFLTGSESWRKKMRGALEFTGGALVANLPAIYFCLTSYPDFMFGMVGYRKLNLLYRFGTSDSSGMTLSEKLQKLVDSFRADTDNLLVLAVAVIGLILLSIAVLRRLSKPRVEVVFLVGLIPFLLMGSLAPTPGQYQYWFALIPFLLLSGLYALASIASPKLLLSGGVGVVIAALISFYNAGPLGENMSALNRVFRPNDWVPVQIHQQSQWIRQQLNSRGQEKILTLSPLYAIEAGLPIYPEFVTGPFAWRVSHLISADEAAARKIPWSPGIAEFLRKEPPMAVLTGKDDPILEQSIVRAITLFGYTPTVGPDNIVLWTRIRKNTD